MVASVLCGVGAGSCWIVCTERPHPRACDQCTLAHDEAPPHQCMQGQASRAPTVKWRDPRQRLQLSIVDGPLAVEIDNGEIGVGTGLNDALSRIKPPNPGWIRGAPTNVVANGIAARRDLGQHHRHLRLDTREAAIDSPDVVARLFLDGVWGMVRCDHVDRAVDERCKQRLLVALFAHRRIDADNAAKAGIVVRGKEQVMRTGLAGDVDAARLGLAQRTQFLSRRNVQDVDARASPFGKDRGATHRLNGDHRRT